jgi:hypothetical protein
MTARFPARYCDRRGEEPTVIAWEGDRLRMVVRGVTFVGDDFDALVPDDRSDEPIALVTLTPVRVTATDAEPVVEPTLTDFELDVDMPLTAFIAGEAIPGTLHVRCNLRRDRARDGAVLSMRWSGEGWDVAGRSDGGYFEEALTALQRALPEGAFLRACVACEWADRGPYQGMFGGIACYRRDKAGLRLLRARPGPRSKWPWRELNAESVPETHCCGEFLPAARRG